MIKFKIKGTKKTHEIPSSWQDVSYDQWVKMNKTDNDNELIAIFSGFPLKAIKQLDSKSLYNIQQALSFIYVKLDVEKYKTPKKLMVEIKQNKLLTSAVDIPFVENIKRKSLGQKIYLQNIIKKFGDDVMGGMIDIILVYAQPIIDDGKFDPKRFDELRGSFEQLNLVDLYSTSRGYLLQFNKIMEAEANKLYTEPDDDKVRAGIDMFEEYDVMNTIKALAKGDILKYEAVLEVEYQVAFIHMAMNKTQAKFEKNYREILKAKNK